MSTWLGRSGLAAALLLVPFSDLVLAAASSASQGSWPPVAPAALAAVSAAVLVVLANPGCLGRHVYDELLEDVLERRRANGWDLEVAASALPVSTPDSIVGESDWRLEAAVREAAVRTESEVARVRQEAGLTLEHALEQARAEADRQRDAAVRETQAAAAVELARVKQEAERTLAVKLQEARAEAARDRDAAAPEVRAAGAAVKTASPVAPPTPTADVVPMAQNSAPTRKQTIEEHIQEARAQLARLKQG